MKDVPSPTTPPPSALLRSGCWAEHKRLESHPVSQLLMSDELTTRAYAQVLATWLLVWSELEPVVFLGAPVGVPPERLPAKRAFLAVQDLSYLGHSFSSSLGLSGASSLPSAENGGWYGIAYVMQGSAMGGAVVAAHLKKLLGLEPGLGASFFSVRSAAINPTNAGSVRHEWIDWTRWVDSQLAGNPTQTEVAVSTAEATFRFIHNTFSTVYGSINLLEKS